MSSSRIRWAVPVVVAATVAGSVLVGSATAGADPSTLAPRTAAELLADLAAPTTDALSGTVTESADLGLPALPTTGHDALGPTTLLTGTHTLRVWTDGPDRSRVALQGQLAEYDVVRSGADVWTWSSQGREATHLSLPARSTGAVPPSGLPSTPGEAASAALAAIGPSTTVAVDDAVSVAGRPARQLVLTPRGGDTLVGSVRIAVDAETHVPLQVQVYAAGAGAPAFQVGFSSVSFRAPAADVFAFTPPAGATVRQLTAPTTPAGAARPERSRPILSGTGWSSVLTLTGVRPTPAQIAQLDQLATVVPQGRLLSTALVSVLLTNDGRLLVGAVPARVLQAAA
ncbi:MAG: hypothetical protein ABI181_08550 [Mycobacteriaceae bacterium]